MSAKYTILKAIVKASGLKKQWIKYSNEELIAILFFRYAKRLRLDGI